MDVIVADDIVDIVDVVCCCSREDASLSFQHLPVTRLTFLHISANLQTRRVC